MVSSGERTNGATEAGGAAGAALASGGAAVTATAAVACCVPILSPLIVTVLGASGAVWLTGLRPYSPYLLMASLILLAYAFRRVYGERSVCRRGDGRGRGRRWIARLTLALLWVVAGVWLAAVAGYFLIT